MTVSVFIIEDNATKRLELERALPAPFEYDVVHTPSISQAYQILSGKSWDLIILDMTFQVSFGAGNSIEKEALAGIEILQYMNRRMISSPVIVATQHSTFITPDYPAVNSISALDDVLRRLFYRNYRATVLVDLSEESWKGRFRDAVLDVLGSETR